MLIPELMSENNLTSVSVTGLVMGQLRLGWRRMLVHHSRLSARPSGVCSGQKGLELNIPNMVSSLVRKACPHRMIEQVCKCVL